MSITPQELKDYSEFSTVKERDDKKLEFDILEAEAYVNSRIKKPLIEYEELPIELKLALLKVAQFYALINGDESIVKGYKSERIGDYSYTLTDGTSLSMPDVSNLLDNYMPTEEKKTDGVFLRMRAL